MTNVAIKIENVSKQYRLGVVSTGTLSHDLKRWWATSVMGKEDPYLKIGEANDRATKGTSEYVWALKDINLEIEKGDIVGIIGKNGAGKSTLLKLLSRVTKPTTGSIKYNGRIASLLEVGTGFHPEMTGRENIFMNGAIMGMSRAEISDKLDMIIDFAGIERYIDTPVKRYSSGMTVRLGFSIAAHLEPDILVVDEVLAVGDAEFQKKAIGKMQDVSKGGGRTVLFVSHNMAAVKSLCKTGILLANGSVDKIDNVENIISLYYGKSKAISSNLNDRSDRTGAGNFRYTSIFMYDKYDKSIVEIISGEYVKFVIDYRNKIEDIDPAKFIWGILIKDFYEHVIIGYSSIDTGLKLLQISDEGQIIIEIPKMLLRGGKYYVRLFASYKDSTPENFEDVIDNAFTFDVLQGDYWNTGVINRAANEAIVEFNIYSK